MTFQLSGLFVHIIPNGSFTCKVFIAYFTTFKQYHYYAEHIVASAGENINHSDKLCIQIILLYKPFVGFLLSLQTLFSTVADKRILDAFYYHVKPNVIPEDMRPENVPAVLVFKDGLHYQYEGQYLIEILKVLCPICRPKKMKMLIILI